jgi:hypothetical protein
MPVEKIFHLLGPSARWQKCETTFQGFQLSVHYQGQALHLHHAHEARWGYISLLFQDGIKYSSTCLILRDEPMVPTTLRPSGSPFMPIVESEESTFRIGFTARKNCLQNSSCSCRFRNSNDGTDFLLGVFLLLLRSSRGLREKCFIFSYPL